MTKSDAATYLLAYVDKIGAGAFDAKVETDSPTHLRAVVTKKGQQLAVINLVGGFEDADHMQARVYAAVKEALSGAAKEPILKEIELDA